MGMRIVGRERRKLRIRNKVSGTAERPRMSVFRSAGHIYAQVIDDVLGTTLAHVSTLSKELKSEKGTKSDLAKAVGTSVAAALKAQGVDKVVFDRNGYMYHGRIKALADGAREGGLSF